MLVIRNDQMDIFSIPQRQLFESRVLVHVRGKYPASVEANRTDDELIRLVQRGIQKASGYGIRKQQEIIRFIELMFEIDPGFDDLETMRWARAILDEPNLSGQAKICLISQQINTM
jgi:hypothetical protein